jgi:hypothetical protein
MKAGNIYYLFPGEKADHIQDQPGASRRDQDFPDQAALADPKLSGKPAANHGTYNTNHYVTDDPESGTLPELASKPARYCTYNQKPDK